MTIIHIVLFQFKADLPNETVQAACADMLSLKDKCVHPQSGKPYIISSTGGADNSPEGHQVRKPYPRFSNISMLSIELNRIPILQGGLTHGFVVEFANEDDRKHYLEADPAHLGFVKSLADRVEQIRVVDFKKGVF
ncbi:hypothetical protein MMC25_002716 [Agyrium rufum]|nr:hypothetical protein [Agyrium rufum]